ncbi:hypothetical protein [Pseudoalteromonas gelatinilytica]|uniref:SGNH/GDSL hydrolase family protein n=1 Tax=Pseudoalteromonas gelatinilytica TaxID=1703256 RepID=A0A3A3F2V5_9GAMM|nr:hypothetical protein [Pseudoalteromonas profundi]RJF36558.1 hypothetical protein D4741_00315 [Pseudoalteromonas profundi]
MTENKRFRPLTVYILLSCCIGLVACGSGSNTENSTSVPDTSIPNSGAAIVDNRGSADYQIIIYGNSHSAKLGDLLEQLISSELTNAQVSTLTVSGRFLDEIVNTSGNVEKLQQANWTHAIFQGQKYSQSGSVNYSTNEAERLIASAKELKITPILFPEHPQQGDSKEGELVYQLHLSISEKEASCVAPIGLVWDKAIAALPELNFYSADGNHASNAGHLLTAMTFYEVITGELADTLAYNAAFAISEQQHQQFGQIITQVLAEHPACPSS